MDISQKLPLELKLGLVGRQSIFNVFFFFNFMFAISGEGVLCFSRV